MEQLQRSLAASHELQAQYLAEFIVVQIESLEVARTAGRRQDGQQQKGGLASHRLDIGAFGQDYHGAEGQHVPEPVEELLRRAKVELGLYSQTRQRYRARCTHR